MLGASYLKQIGLCILSLLLCSLGLRSKGQPSITVNQSIKGKIINQLTGEPVAGVTIQLSNAACCNATTCTNCQCVSQSDGGFQLNYGCAMTSAVDLGLKEIAQSLDTLYIQAASYQSKQIIRARNAAKAPLTIYIIPKENELLQVLVTASRFKQLRSDIPAAVSVMDSSQIADTKATSMDQLLNQ